MAWYSGDVATDPAAGTVLVDTGPAKVGADQHQTRAKFVIWADNAIEVIVQHRNAANDGDIASQVVPVVWASRGDFAIATTLRAGERLRVVARGDVSGKAQASIVTED